MYIRQVNIPLEEGEEGVIAQVRQPDGSYVDVRLNTKIVDGVMAGTIKSEDDIPIPVVCEWFEIKELG